MGGEVREAVLIEVVVPEANVGEDPVQGSTAVDGDVAMDGSVAVARLLTGAGVNNIPTELTDVPGIACPMPGGMLCEGDCRRNDDVGRAGRGR